MRVAEIFSPNRLVLRVLRLLAVAVVTVSSLAVAAAQQQALAHDTELIAPDNGASFPYGTSITIVARGLNTSGIGSPFVSSGTIDFFVDGSLVGSSSLFPYCDGYGCGTYGIQARIGVGPLSLGTHTIRAQLQGETSSETRQITIVKADQTISFSAPPTQTFASGSVVLTATGGASGNPITFASTTTSVCSTGGTNGATVTFLTPGTCSITANQAGNANYNDANAVSRSFNIDANPQTITFTTTPVSPAVGGNYSVGATGGASGNAVTFSIDPASTSGSCSIAGNSVSFAKAGTCIVNANQAGNAIYAAAPQVQQVIAVAKGNQTITFNAQVPPTRTFSPSGTFPINPQASASTGLPVTYSSLSGSVCLVSGTNVAMLDIGDCIIAANQAGNDDYNAAPQVQQTIAFGKADQTVSFTSAAPASATVGGASYTPTATANSGLTVAFSIDAASAGVCAISGGSVSFTGVGTCIVVADQAGNATYNPASPVQQSFAVDKAAQTISFTSAAPGSATVGGASYAPTATASSGLTVAFSIDAGSAGVCAISGGSVSFTGPGTCIVAADQAGDATYNPAPQVTQSFAVTLITVNVALTTNQSSGLIGEPIAFTAAVTPANATGTVTFVDGSTPICTAVPLSGGLATCTAPFATAGSHSVTASFAGSGSFTSSVSNTLTIAISDQRGRTTQVVGQFLSQRNNQILTNEPDASRQIDRLRGAETGGSAPGGTDFADAGPRTPSMGAMATGITGSRMGLGFGSPKFTSALPGGRGLLSDGSGSDDNGMSDTADGAVAGSLLANRESNGSMRTSFATSLSQMQRLAFAGERRKEAQAGLGMAPMTSGGTGPKYNPFDLWVEGKYAQFSGDGGTDEHFGLLSAGADYVLNRNLLVGVMGQVDSMRQNDDAGASEVSGIGFLVGPYATMRLTDQVFLQVRAAWGLSDNEVSPFLTYTDSFESSRWLVASTLTGSWTSGAWRFDPSASIAYMQDTSDSYRDTFGVLIPSVASELGQAKAGPKISYRSVAADGTIIEPFASAQIIWNFADDLNGFEGTTIDTDLAGPEGARGRLELGLRSMTSSGLSLDFAGSYDGIGSSAYEAWTGRASASVPLN